MPFVAWAAFCLAPLYMAPLCMGGLLRDGVCVVPYFRTAISCMVRPAHEAYLPCERLGGVATAVVLESWLMERAFARRPWGMPFIDFDAGHA